MSATIDSDMFAAYFCMPRAGRAEPAPVMVVEGRHYDVQEFFLEDLQELGQVGHGSSSSHLLPMDSALLGCCPCVGDQFHWCKFPWCCLVYLCKTSYAV